MATTDITTDSTVYPSENQIETTEYEGSRGQESNHSEYADGWIADVVKSGLNIASPTHGDLDVPVNSGVCYIAGHRIKVDGANDITLAPSTTNYVYIQITLDGNDNVDVVQLVSNTTGTPPSNSIELARCVTDGSGMTARATTKNTDPYKEDRITGRSLDLYRGRDTDAAEDIGTSDTDLVSITIAKGDLKGRDPDILCMFSCYVEREPGDTVTRSITFKLKLNGADQYTTIERKTFDASGDDDTVTVSFQEVLEGIDQTIANTIKVTAVKSSGVDFDAEAFNSRLILLEIGGS